MPLATETKALLLLMLRHMTPHQREEFIRNVRRELTTRQVEAIARGALIGALLGAVPEFVFGFKEGIELGAAAGAGLAWLRSRKEKRQHLNLTEAVTEAADEATR
jgi:hypothetical protein